MRTVERKPTTPGEILREEFLKPLGMTQKKLADQIGCPITVINRIVNHRISVTAKMATKLAATFGTTTCFWLNTQEALNLYEASKEITDTPKKTVNRGTWVSVNGAEASKEITDTPKKMVNRGKWVSVNGAVELPFPSEYMEVKAAFNGRNNRVTKSLGCRIYYVKRDRLRASMDHKLVIDLERDVYVRSQPL